MQVRPAGPRALLVEVDGPGAALSLALWSRSLRLDELGVSEVVPAATTVLYDGVEDVDRLVAALERWAPAAELPEAGEVTIAVTYDGEDLDAVAQAWGTDREGVVEQHTGTTFVGAFCGFAPGFTYLTGLPDDLAVPRLDSPRQRVPAGSVGLAGAWCGVYPSASPGGWQLIGRTDTALWDPTDPQPALIAPGTRVRFRDAS